MHTNMHTSRTKYVFFIFFLFLKKDFIFSLPCGTFKTSFLLNLASSVDGFFFHDVSSLEELLLDLFFFLSFPSLCCAQLRWEF